MYLQATPDAGRGQRCLGRGFFLWGPKNRALFLGPLQEKFISTLMLKSICFRPLLTLIYLMFCIDVDSNGYGRRVTWASGDTLSSLDKFLFQTCLTPAMQAGTRFTYPGGMEGSVDLVDLIAPRRESNFKRPFDHESDAQPLHH